MIKKLLYGLVLVSTFLFGATIIRLNTIRGAGSNASTLVYVDKTGNIKQATVSGLVIDDINNVVTVLPTPALPALSAIKITSSTPNSFPIPSGRQLCYVTRNIAQSPGEDYVVQNGNIVFNTPPEVGDIVQLLCF